MWGRLVDHHRPRVVHPTVLDVGERLADQLVNGLLLLHGGYVQILAEVVDPVHRTDHTRRSRTEELQ